jgi:hypothetical protein
VVRVPDPDTQRRQFAELPVSSRRQVMRAVNRGRAVDDRRLAGHAVVVARRQQRLWRWVWVVGPVIGLTQIGLGWQAVVAAVLLSTITMGLMSRFWWGRARAAEAANLALTGSGKRRRSGHTPKKRNRRHGRPT